MMHRIRAFLFDFDGTILDSRKAIVNVFYTLCQIHGQGELSYDDVNQQFGTSFRSILAGLGEEKKREVEADYFRLLLAEEEVNSRLFPGVKENIGYLKEEGCKVALVTNKEKPLVMKSLQKFAITGLFDGIVTINDVVNPKPHAEPVEKALEMLGAKKDEAIMIGDSVFDVGAARNAGVCSAVLDWHHLYPVDEILPDYLFENIGDLMLRFAKYKVI